MISESKNYRRDTAFLYPNLESCTPNERIHTLALITQITAIVAAANSELLELVDGGNFSFVNCMPTVHMECVSDVTISSDEYENVRICVVRFDQCDYMKCYENLITDYHSGITKISHLVALNITSHQQKTAFAEDPNGQFDTMVTVNLGQLERILVSIMFDISLYHYFGLSNDLADRKKFNGIKYEYLHQKLDNKAQIESFGHAFPTHPIYLPASLPDVKKLNRRTKRESRQEIVNGMLNSYATFLTESAIASRIRKDSDGCIMKSDDPIPPDISGLVEEIVREKSDSKKFSIVFLKDSTGNITHQVVEYSNEGTAECWVTKNTEAKTLYKIVSVRQGGDAT